MGTRPFPGEDGENQLVARRHGVDRGDASPGTRSKGEQHDQIPSADAEEGVVDVPRPAQRTRRT
eukprot:13899971-Alexandrium_andersonii.AAC.1